MSDAFMLRDQDIICLSSIDWQFIWQGHQEIMSALAANGNRVLFVENTGVRTPSIRDLPRVRRRLGNWWRGTKGFRRERENLFVFSPVILPFPYSRLARVVNRAILGRALRRWMRAARFGRPIVWTFLPTPLMREVIRDLDPRLTIYYCIDDLASSSAAARRITPSEEQLFRESDLVFVTSEALQQRARRHTDRVHLFPFAVSFAKFDRVRETPGGIPEDLSSLPRPIAGYVGGVHQWIDFPLVRQVATALPNVTFAFVGPLQTDVSELSSTPNIRFLGQRPHDDVPKYVKGFDVGLVPYRLSTYTANVYPTKLNEYLAMGLPVVATDLPEIRRFNGECGRLVGIAKNPEEFARAVQTAVQNTLDDDAKARRIMVARQNSWAARLSEMCKLIEAALESRQRESSWEDRLRRLYRGARGRVAAAAIGLALLYVLVFETALPWWLASPLRRSDVLRPADAIVVFAGGVGESGRAGGGYQERVKQAVSLYRQGLAPRMVFSSGYGFAFSEPELMRELAEAEQVPAEAILLETHAANTYDNVRFTRDILAARRWRTILLVSSPYHMRRALLTWRKVAPQVDVIAAPAPASQFYTHDRGASVEQVRGLLHEYAAIVVYWWKGWI